MSKPAELSREGKLPGAEIILGGRHDDFRLRSWRSELSPASGSVGMTMPNLSTAATRGLTRVEPGQEGCPVADSAVPAHPGRHGRLCDRGIEVAPDLRYLGQRR